KTAQAGMLVHRRLALGEVDAERLVVGDERLHPLDAAGQLRQRPVGGCGCLLELLAIEPPYARQTALDHISLHRSFSVLGPMRQRSRGPPGGRAPGTEIERTGGAPNDRASGSGDCASEFSPKGPRKRIFIPKYWSPRGLAARGIST